MSSLPRMPEIRGGKGGAVPAGNRRNIPNPNLSFRHTPPAFDVDLVALGGFAGGVNPSPGGVPVNPGQQDFSRWLHPGRQSNVVVVRPLPNVAFIAAVYDAIEDATGHRPSQGYSFGHNRYIGPNPSANLRTPAAGGQAPQPRPPFNPRLGTPPPTIRGLNGQFLPFQGAPNFPTEVQIPVQPTNQGGRFGLSQSRVPVSQFATGAVIDRGRIAQPGGSGFSRLVFALRAVRSGNPILVAAFTPLAIHEATNAYNSLNAFVASQPSFTIAHLIQRAQIRDQLQALVASAVYGRQHVPGQPRDC